MRLSTLQQLYQRDGPRATAYLEPGVPDAQTPSSVELRWRRLADQLRGDGADEPTVQAMQELVTIPRRGQTAAEGLVVVASRGEVQFSGRLQGPVGGDQSRWAPLPALGPYVRANATARPAVIAIVDRAGADLVVRDLRRTAHRQSEGQQHPLHKVRGGGLAHKRIQNTVEEVSDRNARQVADELAGLVGEVDPSVIVLAGEAESRSRVLRHMPAALQPSVRTTDHGARGEGSSAEALHALDVLAEEVAETSRAALLDHLRAGLDGGTAAEGVVDVAAALRQAAVETLVFTVADPDTGTAPDSARQLVAVGAEPEQLASSVKELEYLITSGGSADAGDHGVWSDQLDAAIVRAGAATDATAVVVPRSAARLHDDIGAILRFPIPTNDR
jgi:hypothetical protein